MLAILYSSLYDVLEVAVEPVFCRLGSSGGAVGYVCVLYIIRSDVIQ